ncbi:MAG: hypothetical protein AAFZ74_00985 [Pseudomonadota bacterium]
METKITKYTYSQVLDLENIDIESYEISDAMRERIERMNEQLLMRYFPPQFNPPTSWPPKRHGAIIDLKYVGA